MPLTVLQTESLPSHNHHDIHAWVDYVEILCLTNVSREVSRDEVLDRVAPRAIDLGEGELDDDSSLGYRPSEEGQANDKWDQRVGDWFIHLRYRQGAFGAAYPFRLVDGERTLQCRDDIGPEQLFYVFLLVASMLGRVHRKHRDSLTRSFERLSRDALTTCMPPGAEVHLFGTSSESDSKYSGHIWSKLCQLAKDLGVEVKAKRDDFPDEAAGDEGLDVVAWVPMGDALAHRLIAFGQCACTDEWDTKQFSSSPDKWSRLLDLPVPPSNFAFIPHCFRRSDGKWHIEHRISSILVDRARMLHLMRGKLDRFAEQPCCKTVEKLLEEHEDLWGAPGEKAREEGR